MREFKSLEETISVSAMCFKIINSLPTKFNNFRTEWDSVDTANQTLSNLTTRLKEGTCQSQMDDETSRHAL